MPDRLSRLGQDASCISCYLSSRLRGLFQQVAEILNPRLVVARHSTCCGFMSVLPVSRKSAVKNRGRAFECSSSFMFPLEVPGHV